MVRNTAPPPDYDYAWIDVSRSEAILARNLVESRSLYYVTPISQNKGQVWINNFGSALSDKCVS